jgi:hypothetical protein
MVRVDGCRCAGSVYVRSIARLVARAAGDRVTLVEQFEPGDARASSGGVALVSTRVRTLEGVLTLPGTSPSLDSLVRLRASSTIRSAS